MSEMMERVALAVQTELRRQGVLYEDVEDPAALMMGAGEVGDLALVVGAIMRAMREPTEAMLSSVEDFDVCWAYEADGRPGLPADVWRAMIDAAQGER